MKITWDSQVLTDETAELPQHGFTLNGQQLIQEEAFLRAAAMRMFARKNRSIRLAFQVERTFGTIKGAEEFVLGHYGSLVDGPATLTCTCGLASESPTDVLIQNAVLLGVQHPQYRGVSVLTGYSFVAPAINAIYTPANDEVRTGSASITSGVITQDFTGLAFPSTPSRVIVSVRKPSGGMQIFGNVVDGSITTDGFTVDFDAVIPASGYNLDYFAAL